MLDARKKCEKCSKPNCEVLYFDKIRKCWNCKECTSYLDKKEKEWVQIPKNKGNLS